MEQKFWDERIFGSEQAQRITVASFVTEATKVHPSKNIPSFVLRQRPRLEA